MIICLVHLNLPLLITVHFGPLQKKCHALSLSMSHKKRTTLTNLVTHTTTPKDRIITLMALLTTSVFHYLKEDLFHETIFSTLVMQVTTHGT